MLIAPERAREILNSGNIEGEFRKHMTDEEIEHVFEIWQQTGQSSSFYEILKLIASKQIK
jgi:hypothetical protein